MKKSEDYLGYVTAFTTRQELYEIGRQMQIDAIKTAVNTCAEKARLIFTGTLPSGDDDFNIDRQHILSLSKQLIDEL